MDIHPKVKIARTLALCARARKAIEVMFEEVYDATANLESMGIHGLTDVLDKAVEDLRNEIAIVEANAKAQRPLPPGPTSPTPTSPTPIAGAQA